MSIFCPIVNRKVIYQFCEDCTDKVCRYPRTDKVEDNKKGNENECRHTKRFN